MPETTKQLEMYVVYRKPKDYPKSYVVRRWYVGETPQATDDIRLAPTLKEARQTIPEGLCRLPRAKGDEPAVVETWV